MMLLQQDPRSLFSKSMWLSDLAVHMCGKKDADVVDVYRN